MCGEDGFGLLELFVIEVENVDTPGAAEFDAPDTEVVQYRALLLEIVIDFIGESRQCPHANSLSFGRV